MQRSIENEQIIYESKRHKQCNPTGKHLKPISGYRTQLVILLSFGIGAGLGVMLAQITQLNRDLMIAMMLAVVGLLSWRFARFPDPSRVPHHYKITIDTQKYELKWRRFGWRLFEPMFEMEEFPIAAIKSIDIVPRQHCYILRLFFEATRHAEIDIPDENTGRQIQADIEATINTMPKDDVLYQINYQYEN